MSALRLETFGETFGLSAQVESSVEARSGRKLSRTGSRGTPAVSRNVTAARRKVWIGCMRVFVVEAIDCKFITPRFRDYAKLRPFLKCFWLKRHSDLDPKTHRAVQKSGQPRHVHQYSETAEYSPTTALFPP